MQGRRRSSRRGRGQNKGRGREKQSREESFFSEIGRGGWSSDKTPEVDRRDSEY